jgi:hypothetical protein
MKKIAAFSFFVSFLKRSLPAHARARRLAFLQLKTIL